MVRINRPIIAKAIFSVSVVAVTATAGAVGFAQAASNSNRGAVLATSNGYGGTGAAVQAAVEENVRELADMGFIQIRSHFEKQGHLPAVFDRQFLLLLLERFEEPCARLGALQIAQAGGVG